MRIMTARFMKGTPYAALKIEMQRPPGFRPRKSGMIISRCVCGTQDCGCGLCAHKERNGTDQTAKGCACLCEQILAGCTPLSKRMGDLTAEAAGKPFVARVARMSEDFSSIFFLAGHQERFDRLLDGKSDPADTDVLYAALYLLSADRIINVIRAKRDLAYCLPLSYDLQGLNAFAKTLARKDILSSEDGSNKLMAALEAELPEDMEAALEIEEKYQKYGDCGGVKARRSPFFI